MTATERLRQLLDERGVKWRASKAPMAITSWHGAHGFKFVAMNPKGTTDYLLVQTNTFEEWPHLSPEQAVEATLGRGTCDMEFTCAAQFGDPNDEDSYFEIGMFRCTVCGTETYGMWNDDDECREWPRYCPNCGRRVES